MGLSLWLPRSEDSTDNCFWFFSGLQLVLWKPFFRRVSLTPLLMFLGKSIVIHTWSECPELLLAAKLKSLTLSWLSEQINPISFSGIKIVTKPKFCNRKINVSLVWISFENFWLMKSMLPRTAIIFYWFALIVPLGFLVFSKKSVELVLDQSIVPEIYANSRPSETLDSSFHPCVEVCRNPRLNWLFIMRSFAWRSFMRCTSFFFFFAFSPSSQSEFDYNNFQE